MLYYSRVFCTVSSLSISKAIAYANSKGNPFLLSLNKASLEKYSNGSSHFEITYSLEKQPINVDINVVDEVDAIAKEEVKEFIADLGFAGFSSIKRKIIRHLEQTLFIVACEMPDDMNEDGQAAIHLFLQYYVTHCNGLLHVDGEGFYNDDMTLLLPD